MPITRVVRTETIDDFLRQKHQREPKEDRTWVPAPPKLFPPRFCTRCGGTADKPFERLYPFHVRHDGAVTSGWSCNGRPLPIGDSV